MSSKHGLHAWLGRYLASDGDGASVNDLRSVRERALLKLLRWVPLSIAVGYAGNWLQRHDYQFPLMELATIPAALALIALVEWITGRRIADLNAAWMRLRGWQRLVLGLLVIFFAYACIVASLGLFLDFK